MTKNDVKALLSQDAIPLSLQKEVFRKALELISQEKEFEVVASTRSITVDVYDAEGNKLDTFTYKIPSQKGTPEANINFLSGIDVCGLS